MFICEVCLREITDSDCPKKGEPYRVYVGVKQCNECVRAANILAEPLVPGKWGLFARPSILTHPDTYTVEERDMFFTEQRL